MRIRIKQFQNDSDSLKIRKLKDKKCLTEIAGFVVVSAVTWDLTMIYKRDARSAHGKNSDPPKFRPILARLLIGNSEVFLDHFWRFFVEKSCKNTSKFCHFTVFVHQNVVYLSFQEFWYRVLRSNLSDPTKQTELKFIIQNVRKLRVNSIF